MVERIQKYKLEALGHNITAFISAEHAFGTDAFLLADFAAPKRKEIVCDMGTGCGIIPLLWYKEHMPKQVFALDIQQQAIEQLEAAVEFNKLENKIVPMLCDIKEIASLPVLKTLDLVTMNPPYQKVTSGVQNNIDAIKIARHELHCTLEDVCNAASTMLRFGGRCAFCYPTDRLAEVLSMMGQKNLEPKQIRFISKHKNSAPWLFLVEGKKGAKQGIKVLPPLFITDENGKESQELIRILGSYRNK